MKSRLLVVDDEPRLTSSFKIIFENKGFFVKTSSNGHDATRMFKKYPFKVVLSDIRMNGIDGVELMHLLKQIDPCVQIIFLTGYASIKNAAKVLKQNNAFDYLQKPVKNMDELHKTIELAEENYDREKFKLLRENKYTDEFATFRNLFDSIEANVYVSDIQTHDIIYSNKKLLKTLGYDGHIDFNGQKCWKVFQKGLEGPCSFCTNKRLLMPDGSIGEPYEYEFLNPYDQCLYNVVDKAVKWHDNRIVRLTTAFDITDKKEHENLFREFEKTIETSQKLESISIMAGGVAHDFNNTLAVIIGNINLAQLTCPDETTQKYLKTAENGVLEAKSISSNLSAFSIGNKPFKAKCDINNLIKQIFTRCLDHENITCSMEADPIPSPFYADANQLETAITNILQNSAEAIKGSGRIDISIRYQEEPLKIPRIDICISDSGCGIPREHLDMIFHPYFTTKPLDNRKSKGLGLSIAWSIITRHGGSVRVDSTFQSGTSVYISLPLLREHCTEDMPPGKSS